MGFAGDGAFEVIHKAEEAPVSVGKKSIEDAFNVHIGLGPIILLLMLVLLILSLAGRLGESALRWSGGIFLLGVVQAVLGVASTSVPALGFLHALNALAIFVTVGLLAHRVGRADRSRPAAPVTAPSAGPESV